MVMTAYVMIGMKGERPRRGREEVQMRADNEAAVTLVRTGSRGGVRRKRR